MRSIHLIHSNGGPEVQIDLTRAVIVCLPNAGLFRAPPPSKLSVPAVLLLFTSLGSFLDSLVHGFLSRLERNFDFTTDIEAALETAAREGLAILVDPELAPDPGASGSFGVRFKVLRRGRFAKLNARGGSA